MKLACLIKNTLLFFCLTQSNLTLSRCQTIINTDTKYNKLFRHLFYSSGKNMQESMSFAFFNKNYSIIANCFVLIHPEQKTLNYWLNWNIQSNYYVVRDAFHSNEKSINCIYYRKSTTNIW